MWLFAILLAAAALGFADRLTSLQRAALTLGIVTAVVAFVGLRESLL